MKSKSGIVWFVLLVAVPTLLAGGLSLRLLRREAARLQAAALAGGEDRTQLLAENLLLTVRETQDRLMVALRAMPPASRREQLIRWERDNPLVRNVFIWRRDGGVTLPSPSDPLTAEERGFLHRYDDLFAGRAPWVRAAPAEAPAPGRGMDIDFSSSAYAARKAIRKAVPQQAALAEAPASATPGGWMPWFAGPHLYLLGWVEEEDGEGVYGVELELDNLLSRLLPTIPGRPPDGGVYALLDGDGQVQHQAGDYELDEAARAAVRVSLAPLLPHWTLAWYPPRGAAAPVGRSFAIVSTLLAGALMAAVLAGGLLLLFESRRHAREALRKTSFVSNVSHELKTPLTTIRMYAELLDQGRIADEAKRERYQRVIIQESERLTRLVNNVLDFSRLEQRRKKYRPERLELTTWLADFAARNRPRLEDASLRLTVEAPAAPVEATIDRDALEQVLLNLVDNAVKYAGAGGEIRATLARGARAATLAVCDRGPGVPRALREKIFEQFYRADASLTTRIPGSGLGLSIARSLMRGQGGDLRCEDAPGGGACFRIEFPAEAGGGGPTV